MVRVTQDGRLRYINLTSGNVLFEQPASFDLGSGITANTVHYEKFLGYQTDGTEHGWNVDFPELSGLPDAAMQKQINEAIRQFFLEGPSVTAEYQALEGSYGASIEGSVLVVWANALSQSKGEGASVWNNSLAFDLRTGAQYEVRDLFSRGYMDTVEALLPQDHPIYLYNYPRVSAEGVTWYYNEYESETRRAYTESYLLTFAQLDSVVNKESDLYTALHNPVCADSGDRGRVPRRRGGPLGGFVHPGGQRARPDGGRGRAVPPNDRITAAEAVATIVRSLQLPDAAAPMPGLPADAWYTPGGQRGSRGRPAGRPDRGLPAEHRHHPRGHHAAAGQCAGAPRAGAAGRADGRAGARRLCGCGPHRRRPARRSGAVHAGGADQRLRGRHPAAGRHHHPLRIRQGAHAAAGGKAGK